MCRYGFSTYKEHYACFGCRKAFKSPRWANRDQERPKTVRCPQCAQNMVRMGLDFRPPPQRDAKRWKVLEELYAEGVTFRSCGCGGPGWRPQKAYELEAFLEQRKEWRPMSPGEALLKRLEAG